VILFAVMLTLAVRGVSSDIQAASEELGVTPAQAVELAQEAEIKDGRVVTEGGGELTAAQLEERAAGADPVELGQPQKTSLPLYLLQHLGGSIVGGVVVGLLMSVYVRAGGGGMPIVLVLSAFGIALASEALGLETLLVGLTAGLLMANVYSERTHPLFETIEELSMPVYVLFFAVAGAKIEPAALGAVWPAMLMLVGARLTAIWASATAGAKLGGVEKPASDWIWTAFIPQAGVSLALAIVVRDRITEVSPELADKVFGLLLASIACNELMGPVLLKFGFQRSGEIGE
jgi:Kef-type K+ transport system membrane component KefB